MKRFILATALLMTATATAGERVDHFQGLPAESLEQAVANFSEYNVRLAAILENDTLTAEDMHRIHELTYTLENALEKINADLTALADTLEELHVASETAQYEAAQQFGAAYLEKARKVIP
ncbi:hypothetical protein CAI21_09530 [Alkalilimnicola ehrlichii]|uniref:Uncharacterized protein n=1 Tax=Alkalilimnicola ehrlichii TaxID=351052 RepID=A0A3E0WXD1_9GAMM|nr:DUF6746 family protein [Alkalilimnicola ehrlichii]RFA29308.1 hypothetical protein CAI21_09530 [Alkalilimnicola ehrlichii]RFA36821.1 hypothetical protein CAL65_09860 [Alkalilimnicola ehrlichii]